MRVVVLGGGFAGILAARRIAKAVRDEASVVLVSATDTFRERVRFHELAAGREIPGWSIEQLIAPSGATLACTTARTIDLANRRIDGEAGPIDYNVLVYAVGSAVDLASVPGVAEHAHSVTDEASACELAAAVRELPDGATVCVCGGGMTGVEVATELVEAFPTDVSLQHARAPHRVLPVAPRDRRRAAPRVAAAREVGRRGIRLRNSSHLKMDFKVGSMWLLAPTPGGVSSRHVWSRRRVTWAALLPAAPTTRPRSRTTVPASGWRRPGRSSTATSAR